ncbi:MAG TPA: hypothetical protein VLB47_05430, partial [Solirubrobacteraceae bacterium]|nr:hypothetical protein [Solirubrobacteraceae bacterium]
RFVVVDTFDGGPELVETVSGRQGTRSRPRWRGAWRRPRRRVTIHQQVRRRLLRALPPPGLSRPGGP